MCIHDRLDSIGNCVICGEHVGPFDNNSSIRTRGRSQKQSNGIMDELAIYPVSDDIKFQANQVFFSLNSPTKRGAKRQNMIFYCLYKAYKDLNIVKSPGEIASMVGITQNQMQRAITQNTISNDVTISTPIDMIKPFCNALDFHISVESVEEKAKEIIDKSINSLYNLNETSPVNTAAAILLYYLNIHGCKYDKAEFSRILKVPIASINSIYTIIERLDTQ